MDPNNPTGNATVPPSPAPTPGNPVMPTPPAPAPVPGATITTTTTAAAPVPKPAPAAPPTPPVTTTTTTTVNSKPPTPPPTNVIVTSGGSRRNAFILGALAVFLLVGLVLSVYLVQRQQSQNIGSKATAQAGKSGCSDMCSGNPPTCTGDVTLDEKGSQPPACSSVTVVGMPETMNAWAVVNPTYNQPVNCVARDSQKADCSCQAPAGKSYCWMGLESLTHNGGVQGHRWASYVYDKATNQLKRGGDQNWVLYDDNGSQVPRWGNDTYFGPDSVLNCGERHEYREQADISSPGSWVETGQVIYAEPTGCTTAASAACQMVSADKDLTKINIGDTVKFTGYGSVSAGTEKIDKINFILTKDDVSVKDTTVDAVRALDKDSAGSEFYVATESATISAAGSYKMRIRIHWQSADQWLE